MTLADFAVLIDATPKWVLNTLAVLGSGVRYTVAVAERLALVRVLNRDLFISLPRAWELAGGAMAGSGETFEFTAGDGTATLAIDLNRLRAAVATRRSQVATMPARRRAGRKPRRQANALIAARDYGIDVTLLQANLSRRPAERLERLDSMMAFRMNVRRKP